MLQNKWRARRDSNSRPSESKSGPRASNISARSELSRSVHGQRYQEVIPRFRTVAKGEADQPFVTFNGDDEAYGLPVAPQNPQM